MAVEKMTRGADRSGDAASNMEPDSRARALALKARGAGSVGQKEADGRQLHFASKNFWEPLFIANCDQPAATGTGSTRPSDAHDSAAAAVRPPATTPIHSINQRDSAPAAARPPATTPVDAYNPTPPAAASPLTEPAAPAASTSPAPSTPAAAGTDIGATPARLPSPAPRRPPLSVLLAGGLRPYAAVQNVSPLLPFYDEAADWLVTPGARRRDPSPDPSRRAKAQARSLHLLRTQRQAAPQKKHLIFFSVMLDRVQFRRALYDSGCERSVISRAAYDYLRSKAKTPPVEQKIDTLELAAWFGGKSTTSTEVGVLMKLGNRRRIVWLLLVECFDYELVIGNDIFRGVFEAGIAPGEQQRIIWTDGSHVTYKTVDERLPERVVPDKARDLRLPVHVARDQKIGARGVTAVEVYLPPYEHVPARDDNKIDWASGLIEPINKFTGNGNTGLQMHTHLARPLMLMSLAVVNSTARPVTVKAGDICAYFTPASEIIESAETARWVEYIPYAVANGHAEISRPGKKNSAPGNANGTAASPATPPTGMPTNPSSSNASSACLATTTSTAAEGSQARPVPDSVDPAAPSSVRAAALAASPAKPSTAAPAAPPPAPEPRVLTDVPGKVDPGADGVYFDERAEIPRNAPQVPVASVLGEDCPAEYRPRYEKEIGERILVNDHAFAPELSKAQPMRIRLTDNRVVNITRHLPIDKAKAADNIVLEYARQQIVRESTSPYNAPVVLAKKPDGSWRFCVDYRDLNAVTERDAYEFPLITDMLNALNGSRVFSTIDLSAGFHQIPIEEESRKYTAFSTLSGHWEFNRVPYGLTNSPPWMQRNISLALRGLEWKICVVWIDDIIIFSKSHEEHLQHLSQVLDALRTAGLQVRLKKCKFAVSKVKYLGHVVSGDGVAPLEDNIKDIRDCPEPTTVKELQRVLGLFNYYRRFVKDFSRLSRFLSDYLKGNPNGRTPVKLDDNARLAFNELKQKLIAAPVLAYPDFDKQFIVETDASQHHVGAILSQIGSDGKEHPVAYWSDILAPRASFWSAYKRELWALISACKHWRNYLQIRQEFTARFDQRALKWIFDVKDREPMLAGWIMQLEEYGIRLEYQPGEKHQHVDALTKGPINRNPYLHGGESHAPEAQALKPAEVVRLRSLRVRWPYENAREDMLCLRRPRIPGVYLPRSEVKIGSLALSFNLNEFSRLQREDPLLKPLFDYYEKNAAPSLSDDNDLRRWLEVRKEYIVDPKDRVLYHVMRRKNNDEVRRRRVVPQRMRQAVMHEYHATPQAGHFAFDKAYHRLSNDFYWPGMAAEFYNFCINCQECGAFNHKPNTISTRNLPGHLVNLPAVSRPSERVAMDIHGPYPEVKGFKYMLVITDHFSRFVWLAPLKSQSANEIADTYLKIFLQHGILPSQILTDRGSGFDQTLARLITSAWGIKKKATTAYHPQCNGMPERFNQTLSAMFSKVLENHQENWLDYIPSLAFAYNVALHPSIKVAPVTAMFGIPPVSPLIATLGRKANDPAFPSPEAAQEARLARMEEVWEIVRTADRKAKQRQKYQYDKKHDGSIKYKVNDKVWLFTPHLNRDRTLKGQKRSLLSLWAGPYIVTEVHADGVNYKLKNARGRTTQQWVHVHRLKPYEAKPMPVGIPATFQFLDDFEPANEIEFDFEANSDRWEPDASAPEQEWTVEDFQPRTSVPMAEAPLPDDLFQPRPQPKQPTLPSTKLPLAREPAGREAVAAAPPPAPTRPAIKPASTLTLPDSEPLSSESRVAPELPSEMADLLRDLTSLRRELHAHAEPADIQEELRIWRARAKELNTLLELHLGPQHAYKINCKSAPKSPLTNLRQRLDQLVEDFANTFAPHIEALTTGQRIRRPTTTERIRKFR